MRLPDWLTLSRAFKVGIPFVITGCWPIHESYFTGEQSLDPSIGLMGTWLLFSIVFMGIIYLVGIAIIIVINMTLVTIASGLPDGVIKKYLLLPMEKWQGMRGESMFLAGFLVGLPMYFYYFSDPFLL